eukprot:TRINITY_DN16644_c0_g1_i1.p1 TRINITY_DN16644_c0_g1~~TRINITY_DN16644_c0_g1_i1.p1  ORF type:complete len:184 (-),score=50.01 TRINITY_DN16644_c0_g1_i1:48-545(-)
MADTSVPLSRSVFDKYDEDESGGLSNKEFQAMCYDLGYHLTDEEVTLAVVTLDKDGSGVVEYNEFIDFWRTDKRFQKLHLSEEELSTLRQCSAYFKYFDKDHSGTLDLEEFKSCHADLLKNNMTTKDLESAIADLDQDGNGSISFNEYVEWLIRIQSIRVKVMEV